MQPSFSPRPGICKTNTEQPTVRFAPNILKGYLLKYTCTNPGPYVRSKLDTASPHVYPGSSRLYSEFNDLQITVIIRFCRSIYYRKEHLRGLTSCHCTAVYKRNDHINLPFRGQQHNIAPQLLYKSHFVLLNR